MSALTRQILKYRAPLPNRASHCFPHLSKWQAHHLMVQAKNLGVTLHSSLFIISHIFSISNLPFKLFLDSGHYPTLGPATLIQATSTPQPGHCNELPTDTPPPSTLASLCSISNTAAVGFLLRQQSGDVTSLLTAPHPTHNTTQSPCHGLHILTGSDPSYLLSSSPPCSHPPSVQPPQSPC